jgi:hypothetical protein
MKIKSLLLGSAAASMLAVSGAQAADPIIYAEPEPMEYVRVCDVYGAGFFYIPGTETCLQISGYVWYTIGVRDSGVNTAFAGDAWQADQWNKQTRARLNFDARSETEWGTLRGYARLQGTGLNTVQPGVILDQAFIELGGLRVGQTESAWVQSQGAGVATFGSHTWVGMNYGFQVRQLISYSFQGGNGIHATLSLEHNDTPDTFMPDVVGVVGMNQAWGGVWAKAAYDHDIDDSGVGDSGWAAQLGAQINVPNAPGSSLRVIGYYADNDNAYSVGSRWSVLGSYMHRFTPEVAASVGAQWFNQWDHTPGNAWQAEAMLLWTPVTNFEVRAEYQHRRVSGVGNGNSGFLRFTRYFNAKRQSLKQMNPAGNRRVLSFRACSAGQNWPSCEHRPMVTSPKSPGFSSTRSQAACRRSCSSGASCAQASWASSSVRSSTQVSSVKKPVRMPPSSS